MALERLAILMLDADNAGSIAAHCRRVSEHLAGAGVEVTVVSTRPVQWADCRCLVIDCPAGGAWQRFEYLCNGLSRRLPDFLRIFDMSRFVSNLRFGYDARAAMAASGLLREIDGIVYYQHSTMFGLRPSASAVRCVLVSHGDIHTHPLAAFPIALRLLYSMGARVAYRRSYAVIAVSRFLANVAARYRPDASSVHVVPNGVDLLSMTPTTIAPKLPAGRPFRLLYVGRLAAEKGVDVLLQAMRLLEPEAFELVIVGGGPAEARLRALAGRGVRFEGPVAHGEIARYLDWADALVVPSRSEGQGVVIIEAMSCGVPVVGSQVGGIPELIADGQTGLLFAPGASGELAAQLQRLRSDAQLRESVARNARALVRQFEWSAVLPRFQSVLRGALA